VIAVPPFDAGAVHVTAAVVFPGVALTPVGAPGAAYGVKLFDALDAEPVPVPFVAVTVNVYAVPFVSPLIVHAVAVEMQVMPPGDDVTVYDVGDWPPLAVGAVQVTVELEPPKLRVRIRLFAVSAMNRLPEGLCRMRAGVLKIAATPVPSA
jgi:hypothetical protein